MALTATFMRITISKAPKDKDSTRKG